MKNRFLTLLTVTMLTGSLLVGCGGTETGADNGGSGTNNEANVNSVETEETEQKEMSAEAAEFFARFRDKVAEHNVAREEAREQYPDMTILLLEEVDSPDGMECFGTFSCDFDTDEPFDSITLAFLCENYNKYYIEYVGETESEVEFTIYGTK